MTTPVLRDYQLAAIAAIRRELLAGHRRVALVAPTGSGKTVMGADMVRGAESRGRGILFVAHRRELITQTCNKLDDLGINHGVIMANHPRYQPMWPVQVASIQTLVRRDIRPKADLVIVDECHRIRGKTYEDVLALYPDAVVIGLTATPWRLDGKGLGQVFQAIVVASTVKELIAAGHLVPVTGFAYDAPDLRQVTKVRGDYDEHGLELVMGGKRLLGNMVEQWQRHANGERTVVFAVNVTHSREIAARFQAAGVRAEHLDGATPTLQRDATLRRLRTGETTVVCSVNVISEGWDEPLVSCALLARPTLSVGLYLQMAGRILRPAPGKLTARIHDHAGVILQHGPPDMERDYSLEADVRVTKKSDKPPPMSTCKKCFAIFLSELQACPLCGTVSARVLRPLQETIDGVTAIPIESIKAPVPASEGLQRAIFRTMVAKGRAKGYKPGWASHAFKARFGRFPPRGWAEPEEHREEPIAAAGGGR